MAMESQGVVILGSTGSIGVNVLDVLARHPSQYKVLALSGWQQQDRLYQQCLLHQPKWAVVDSATSAKHLANRLLSKGCTTHVLHGADALSEVAQLADAHTVVAAIVGAAGLPPVLAAARAGKRILLANKEALVIAGSLLMQTVKECCAELLPLDSEHNAIWQVLPEDFAGNWIDSGIDKITLTASGGPFRTFSYEAMRKATPEEACAHPTWAMGRKISVDSATLMNKGLEIIEAHWLFSGPVDGIDVVIHPESILHAMVQYQDGSVLAQLSASDMRVAIARALGWPRRIHSGVKKLDLVQWGALHFEAPDNKRFPCLGLAIDAMRIGGNAPIVLNAANEIAVEAFLVQRIGFCDIHAVIEKTLSTLALNPHVNDLASIIECDQEARCIAKEKVNQW